MLNVPAKDKRKAFSVYPAGTQQLTTTQALTSNPANVYRKEAYAIRKNLTKLVQEVNLIQQNKYVESNKKSDASEGQHPT